MQNFITSESGAVSIDWAVLTAAIIGLGVVVYNVIAAGADNLADNINTELSGITVQTGTASAPTSN